MQSVRGLPRRAVPFYFDSISDGTNRFDFLGHFVAELEPGGIAIDVEAVRGKQTPVSLAIRPLAGSGRRSE